MLAPTGTGVRAAPVEDVGELLGVQLGIPLEPNVYVFNNTNYGGQRRQSGTTDGVDVPIVFWSTPWQVLGGRVELYAAQPSVFGSVTGGGRAMAGLYNFVGGGGIAWKLSPNLGFLYLPGAFAPASSSVAFASGSLRQDLALSYADDDWSTTAHFTYGKMFQPVARFGGGGSMQLNADYVDLELSALRNIGKFQLGPVALGSIDLPVPSSFIRAGYQRYGRVALGALAGYDFGAITAQVYVTRDVANRITGGPDTRAWLRVVVPLIEARKPSHVTQR